MNLKKTFIIYCVKIYADKSHCSMSDSFNFFLNNAKSSRCKEDILKARNYYYSKK